MPLTTKEKFELRGQLRIKKFSEEQQKRYYLEFCKDTITKLPAYLNQQAIEKRGQGIEPVLLKALEQMLEKNYLKLQVLAATPDTDLVDLLEAEELMNDFSHKDKDMSGILAQIAVAMKL